DSTWFGEPRSWIQASRTHGKRWSPNYFLRSILLRTVGRGDNSILLLHTEEPSRTGSRCPIEWRRRAGHRSVRTQDARGLEQRASLPTQVEVEADEIDVHLDGPIHVEAFKRVLACIVDGKCVVTCQRSTPDAEIVNVVSSGHTITAGRVLAQKDPVAGIEIADTT